MSLVKAITVTFGKIFGAGLGISLIIMISSIGVVM